MAIRVIKTELPDVVIIEPTIFSDDRGFFYESFNTKVFQQSTGIACSFVQDNHSKSARGVLRGLHYQVQHSQGKLVRVIEGSIFDVAVDVRRGSPTFGRWLGVELSADNNLQLWVPPDFAHGFVVTSPSAQVLYKTTDYYSQKHERSILWSDPEIGIEWPDVGEPFMLSAKDKNAVLMKNAELPVFNK